MQRLEKKFTKNMKERCVKPMSCRLRICDEEVNDYMQSLLPPVVHFATKRKYLESCSRPVVLIKAIKRVGFKRGWVDNVTWRIESKIDSLMKS